MSATTEAGMKLMTVSHRWVLKLTGGRVLNRAAGMDVVELFTVGRKSGQERSAMLTVPVQHDGHPVIVASRGGDDKAPAWLLNLQAQPDVEVKIRGGEREPRHARVLDEAERAALWPQVVAKYKAYGGYQAKTERVIPLVVLEPR